MERTISDEERKRKCQKRIILLLIMYEETPKSKIQDESDETITTDL